MTFLSGHPARSTPVSALFYVSTALSECRRLRADGCVPLRFALVPSCRADLEKVGLPSDTMKTPSWTENHSDKVAAAILEWAKDNGACA